MIETILLTGQIAACVWAITRIRVMERELAVIRDRLLSQSATLGVLVDDLEARKRDDV